MINVRIYNRQREIRFSPNKESIHDAVQVVLESENESADFVDIQFISDRMMRNLHKQYFNDPSSTDCMSFPMDASDEYPRVLGDIFICPKTALDVAHNDPLLFWEEITLYLIHALLHLLGYEDMTPHTRGQMEQKQNELLRILLQNGQIVSGIL